MKFSLLSVLALVGTASAFNTPGEKSGLAHPHSPFTVPTPHPRVAILVQFCTALTLGRIRFVLLEGGY